MGKNWDKFVLLTWKNWILQIRSPIQAAFEILLPVLVSVLLVLLRGLVNPETNPTISFTPFDLNNISFDSEFTRIAYSPCNNDVIDTIMNNVAESNNLTAQCYDNSQDLEIRLWDDTNNTLAGVQFSDSLSGQNKLDADLTVAIRFPAELRNSTSVIGQMWETNILFPIYQSAGPREPDENEGASPNYFREGFLTLQYHVSKEIIKYHSNDNNELPQVFMQRFPYPSWISDPLQMAMQSFVGLVFMIAFSSVCINTVKVITIEKEKQLKEAMKIMGLTNWLHWTAWFLKTFVLILIAIILMVILLKVSWYPNTDTSLFHLTDPFLLFFFLVCYAITTITFCFAISVFFSKANTATSVGGLIWFLSYVIYLLVQNQYQTASLAQKMLTCLASNSAMAYGFQLILMWEGTGKGLGWSDMFNPVTPDDSFTLGHVIIMLLLDAIIYLLIALYVEAVFPGDYGVPLVWYYPFTRSYWCGNGQYTETNRAENLESEVYEKEPSNLKIGVQLNKVTKVFSGEKMAVKDLSFNMFEGQITVLLGHNGAGKTTTMSMLTGMLTPTSGSAIVNGYNIRTDMTKIRESLGLCPQHNILFDDLTVDEHLYFYSKLKGLPKADTRKEIDTYIQLLDLIPKKTARAKTLSGGMKRKLSVALALCGKSKICMLDEPTAGMDPAARRALWDMVQKQKKDRTILLSTHFMDEADLLGDRIAIMAGGKLQCCGTSFFLKKKYGAGYHLIMDKSKNCDVNEITKLLRRHIPHLTIETNVGSELCYLLAENQSSVFESMLSDLENNSKQLGINSYGISLTTMEEVFMKVGAEHAKERTNNDSDFVERKAIMETNGDSSNATLNIFENEALSGFPLWKNQFMAMTLKKICTTYRNWHLLLIQNLIPIVMLAITLVVVNLMYSGDDLPSLQLSLDAFDKPVTVFTSQQPNNVYYLQYQQILKNEGREILNWELGNMTEKMINETIENTPRVRMAYIIGASFDDDSITAWFNNEPLHSPPISLQYSMNAILQQKTDENHHIQFINYPLPYSAQTKFTQMEMGAGFQIAFNLGFAMSFVMPFYVLFYIKERVSKSKHLQFVSGVKVSTFWLAAAAWDFITFQVTSLCIIITLVCFQEDGFSTSVELGRIYAVLLIFILASLPLMYLASFFFDIPSTGYSRLSVIKIFTGPALFMVVQILSIEGLNLKNVADILHYIFSLLPHYSLAAAFGTISTKYSTISLCNQISSYNISACFVSSSCCDINENYFNVDDGIGISLIYMGIVSIVGAGILLLVEHRMFDRIIYIFLRKTKVIPVTEEVNDSDVLEEKRKINNGEIRPDEYDIVLKDLSKQYSNFYAVNQLCLGVKGYECFGLLGINGAGKTTTFKMMTGDVVMSYGDAWIRNLNLKTHMKEVHKNIGYCPQFDALLDELTGKETLMMYCLLRGIPYQDCSYVTENLARNFDFDKHLSKQVKQFSGGNKRKLSAAIALIGDPAVVFLDEPTAGMDPATKRHLWNTLCNIRDNGKCLVLTSHSMEECEALCTRIAIMVNGVFKCLGSTQHLKNKFSEGYMLIVKVKKMNSNFSNSETIGIEQYIISNFPTAVLRESHQELLTYFIPGMSLSWSKIFGIMERGKREIDNLEDYSLGQSNLEQVFLLFTKQQRESS